MDSRPGRAYMLRSGKRPPPRFLFQEPSLTHARPARIHRLLPLTALALFGCAAAPGNAAPPALKADAAATERLAPHQALYELTLKTAKGSSGVVAAAGAMQYKFGETCEAWTVETNIVLRLSYAEGAETAITWSFAGQETKDGLGYRFRLRHARNGATVDAFKGEARLDAVDAAGEARFDDPTGDPTGETIKLPKGTLFPTRHLAELIAAAEAGKRFFPKEVFDGSSLDNPYRIAAAITAPRRPAGPDKAPDGADAKAQAMFARAGLKRSTVWPMRLAFFPALSREAAPEFELGIDYRADGVAQKIEQDYGDFVIDMRPSEIEALAKPKC
jgi:hypothetical protein